ncbi:RusA family crossover junction endodeoxyribonuclease [Gracilibacillus thailandensis]|uniref:RusA family crossover junction endodeoxyribonuclease n=2 Tax=Gracilibacillus thailandensis TaxID=563735 RepID=UPI00129D1073|nr:RusA family crossover junction endodeoxyribonuclease [Gracilibacillus thailandensis]
MIKFTIPGTLPSMNEIIEMSKKHHMQYSIMKKQYTQLVKLHAMKLPKIERADFVITWYCQDKRKDKDNITSGQKFIFDGLVEAGVLQNDGWKEIGNVAHVFEVDKENPRVQVKIIERERVV